MNKAFRDEISSNSKTINKLWTKVKLIEDKVMRETYTLRAMCPNCCREQWLTIQVGEERPKKYKCDWCKCEVEPKTFVW